MTRKNLSYLLFVCVIAICCPRQTFAQLAPWVYVGGNATPDHSNDVIRISDTNYIAIIRGSETDSITFSTLKLNENGILQWKQDFERNLFTEIPNNICFSEDSSTLFITGFSNADTSLWGIEQEYFSGIPVNSTTVWSDDAGSLTGLNAHGNYTPENAYNIYTYEDGRLIIYKTFLIDEIEDSTSYPYPLPFINNDRIIADLDNTGFGTILIGSYSDSYIPYVWLINDLDSLYYNEPGIDSLILNGVKANYNGGWHTVGNSDDSTQIYLAVYDTIGATVDLAFETLYPPIGYKIVANDIVVLEDGTMNILTVHYDPVGTRTVLMHMDEFGNFISEETILENQGIIQLTDIISAPGGAFPFVLSGSIDTETPEKETEYLIIGSDEDGNFPECIFNCVWPGDANNSGLVDMEDLFPIGAGFLLTGPVRDVITDEWGGYASDIWPDSIAIDLNAKYADCFGDGTIDENDTTAIINNYGLGHEIFNFRLSDGGDFPIWLNTAGIILHSGYNEIPIMLGTEAIPVDEIYGVEFTISYEGAPFIVDSIGLSVYFIDSWFGETAELLELNYKTNDISVDAGAVNTDYINKGGYGQIGKLGFIVEDNIAGIMIESGDSSIIFNISGPTGVLNDLTPVLISGSAYEVWAATAINELTSEENIILYPNPWHGEDLKIFPENYLIQNFEKYTIRDITGRIVMSGIINSNSLPIAKDKLNEQGSYLLELIGGKYNQQFHLIYIK